MKIRSKKNMVIRTQQSRTAEGQATPAVLTRIPGIKTPMVNSGSAYRAAQFADPLRTTPERPPGQQVARSGPSTLGGIFVDVDADEDLMVFRFQRD